MARHHKQLLLCLLRGRQKKSTEFCEAGVKSSSTRLSLLICCGDHPVQDHREIVPLQQDLSADLAADLSVSSNFSSPSATLPPTRLYSEKSVKEAGKTGSTGRTIRESPEWIDASLVLEGIPQRFRGVSACAWWE